MRNVIVTRKVELALTADDWSLYGDNDGHLTDRRIDVDALDVCEERVHHIFRCHFFRSHF